MNHLEGIKFNKSDKRCDPLVGYNDEECSIFDDFKKRVYEEVKGGEDLSDFTLRRFLDADKHRKKGFKVDKSIERLKFTMAWREKYDIDKLRSRVPKTLKYYKAMRVRQFFGFDNQKRPVQIERLGEFFAKYNASCRVLSEDEWKECYAWDIEGIFEEMRKSSTKCGVPVTKYVFIGDLSGFSFTCSADFLSHGVPLLKKLAHEIEKCYPECAGPIILINAPYVVYGMYKAVKVFLDPVTAAKIEIHSNIPTERLLELMSSDALPKELGGTNIKPFRHCVPYGDVLIQRQKDEEDEAEENKSKIDTKET